MRRGVRAGWRPHAVAAPDEPVGVPRHRLAACDGSVSHRSRFAACGRVRANSFRAANQPALANSAAAVGVAARWSATRSAMVKSVSWPMPAITGSGQAAIARARFSVVERPQILDAAAAASDDQHVAFVARRGETQGIRQSRLPRLRPGPAPDGRRSESAARGAPARPARRAGRCLQRRDHADAARKPWQRPLARIVEQTLRGKFVLEAGEGFEQCAETGAPHGFDIELKVAARLIQRYQGANLDLQTVGQFERHELCAVAEHHATHLSTCVLEREIDVTRCGACQIGDLAGDPDQRKCAFECFTNQAIERRNTENWRRC